MTFLISKAGLFDSIVTSVFRDNSINNTKVTNVLPCGLSPSKEIILFSKYLTIMSRFRNPYLIMNK